jgi:hypothetical protein
MISLDAADLRLRNMRSRVYSDDGQPSGFLFC